jgi:ligand-binding SRPBCC domain-containing protein
MNLLFETIIDRNLKAVKSLFNRDLFLELTPPGVKVDLERFDGCSPGHEVHLNIYSFGIGQKWISKITAEQSTDQEWFFIDEGVTIPWPLAKWKHIHRVISIDDKTCKIVDDINFSCTYSWMNPFFYPVLWASFAVRPARYQKFFKRY